MTTGALIVQNVTMIPHGAGKDARSRLGQFEQWQRAQGQPWHEPDLTAYRDTLLADGKAASTVCAHLATIRGRYHAIIRDNATRQALFDTAARVVDGPADRKAFVDEILTRLGNATNPNTAPVKTVTRQDRPDSDHLRLTSEQASALIAAPGVDTLRGLRDTSIIALLLCTGIREAELCSLDVRDLRQRLGGELALHVREGKGAKERLIPYGQLAWVLAIVDRWLESASIKSGRVFCGLYRGGQSLRPGRLSTRAVQNILSAYPIMVDGAIVTARPHDLRRTYSRRLYAAGLDLLSIQQNLGHSDPKTTLNYIGTLNADKRRAPAVYSFDLGKLGKGASIG